MEQYVVIGFPIKHSFSPQIHNPAFRILGIDAQYGKVEIDPGRFEAGMKNISAKHLKGFNITVPFKERILPFVDKLDPMAKKIGAVNTIQVDKNGKWYGYNTDYLGFLDPIGEELKTINHALLIGAGGSAKAVACGLLEKGKLKQLVIANRTIRRAEELAKQFSGYQKTSIHATNLDSVRDITESFDLIINTTTVGMGKTEGQMPIDAQSFAHSDTIYYDLIYNPTKTAFLKSAESAGYKIINGLPMLIGQAAAAFEIWTGQPFPEKLKEQLLNDVAISG